ncbi:DUF421 domain-containing protein [Virgibacillus dakarensis]|uniref:DUF421 domain-containing protein n=1 Tax=Virgibacillus dakarensis TaxID=1917889 RepID=UPI000B435E8C|nr:DUF421 domain-containing protein [Virgibacillus dakarensis]MBT2214980.1 DUF421 domain-containing protein [Virgibacillus dakarensis]MTW84851.1 DUF421 domain-containing protein [Virgibacillus dakarensis]
MDFNWIWQAALIVIVGTFLLRIAGKKTISQMTLAQAVLMVSIGTLLIQPVTSKNVWVTFTVGAVLVLTLLVMEYGQLKFDSLEKLITGKSKILIENGTLNEKALAKVRMTVDQLEMKLRQKNVMKISDVEWATLEPNGQVGFTLKQEAQPATKKEIRELQQSVESLMTNQVRLEQLTQQLTKMNQQFNQENIFAEVKNNEHQQTPPKHLQ